MRYWVYVSPIHDRNEFLVVPENTCLGKLDRAIRSRFKHAEVFKTIVLGPNVGLQGLDVAKALGDLGRIGHHIFEAGIAEVDGWPGEEGIR